jgi:hypothetical protein
MFLMLGEMVLQLIVSGNDDTVGARGGISTNTEWLVDTAAAVSGFVISLTLMFSFREMIVKQLSSFTSTNEDVASYHRSASSSPMSVANEIKMRQGLGKVGAASRAVKQRRTAFVTTHSSWRNGLNRGLSFVGAVGAVAAGATRGALSGPVGGGLAKGSTGACLPGAAAVSRRAESSESLEQRATRLLLTARALNVLSTFRGS